MIVNFPINLFYQIVQYRGNFRISLFRLHAVLTTVMALVLVATTAMAASVQLAWDPNDPTPDGYILFIHSEGSTYNYDAPVWAGADTGCTISGLVPGTTYYLVIRAYVGSDQSPDSNEIVYTPPIEAASTPASSANAISDAPRVEDDNDPSLGQTSHNSDASAETTDGMASVSGLKVLQEEN